MPTPDITVDEFFNAFIRQVTMVFSEDEMHHRMTAADAVLILQTLTIMVRGFMEASSK